MAKKNFGTKRIRAGSAHARQITCFIDARRGRSNASGSYVVERPSTRGNRPRRAEG